MVLVIGTQNVENSVHDVSIWNIEVRLNCGWLIFCEQEQRDRAFFRARTVSDEKTEKMSLLLSISKMFNHWPEQQRRLAAVARGDSRYVKLILEAKLSFSLSYSIFFLPSYLPFLHFCVHRFEMRVCHEIVVR